MEWFKRLIEKMYYKAYPDRINEHAIATSPLPVIREERYTPVILETMVCIPLAANIPQEYIRRELAVKLTKGLENYITIRVERDHISDNLVYRGFIRILKEEE